MSRKRVLKLRASPEGCSGQAAAAERAGTGRKEGPETAGRSRKEPKRAGRSRKEPKGAESSQRGERSGEGAEQGKERWDLRGMGEMGSEGNGRGGI